MLHAPVDLIPKTYYDYSTSEKLLQGLLWKN